MTQDRPADQEEGMGKIGKKKKEKMRTKIMTPMKRIKMKIIIRSLYNLSGNHAFKVTTKFCLNSISFGREPLINLSVS